MFNMALINKWFNKMQQNGIATRLDPVSAEFATQYMQANMPEKMEIAKFKEKFLGEEADLPASLKAHFDGESIKTITLEDFKAELKKITKDKAKYEKLCELSDQMSKLQPQIKGVSILTEGQAKAVINGGLINNPEFMLEFSKNSFGTKFMNKYRFVAQSDIDEKLKDLRNFVNSIISDAKKANVEEITQKMITKARFEAKPRTERMTERSEGRLPEISYAPRI